MSGLKHLVDRVLQELQDKTTVKLRQYLLDELSERERQTIEQRYFADDTHFQELRAVEDDLIHDFLSDRLTAPTRQQFLKMLQKSVSLQEKVNFANTVRAATQMQASRVDRTAILFETIYEQLHKVATRLDRHNEEADLDPVALIHEAYLRLATHPEVAGQTQAQFVATAAALMRSILVDQVRHQRSAKRGPKPVELQLDIAGTERDYDTILSINAAIDRLMRENPRMARIIELRFFGGMRDEDIARTMSLSVRTVRRDYASARVWLASQIGK